MKTPGAPRRRSIGFNMTSLIDIVFLLIIFFLVASHIARSEAVEAVNLPEASEVQSETGRTPQRLVVTVMADRSMYVASREVTLPQLEQTILAASKESARGFELNIRADRNATYAEVEPLLLTCARLGVTQVGFNVLQKREP
jgi:biopolymer transport protein ExbD